MSWWTTVLGGALGFMLGGPLGAMLGVAFAGNFSKGKSNFGGFAKDFHPGILVDSLKIFIRAINSAFKQHFLVVYFQLWVILPK